MRRLLPALLLPLLACGDKDGDDTGGAGDTDATDTDTDTDGGGDTGEDDDGTTGTTEPTGEDLYLANCAACHGDDARGTSSGPDLQHEVERHTDDQLIRVILNGDGSMDPVDVTADEAQTIVDYLRELFPS